MIEFKCPHCGEVVPNANNLTGKGIPVEHDFAYCLSCNNFLQLGNDNKYVVRRKDEMDLFKSFHPLAYSYIDTKVKILKGEPIEPPGNMKGTGLERKRRATSGRKTKKQDSN